MFVNINRLALLISIVLFIIPTFISYSNGNTHPSPNDSLSLISSRPDTLSGWVDTLGDNAHLLPLPEADTALAYHFNDSLFLRSGELWLYDFKAHKEKRLTSTHSQIGKFLISPTGKYVAWTGKIPWRKVVVFNMSTRKVMRRIPPPEDIFVCFEKWVSPSRLLLTCSDEIACEAYYVYDSFRDSLQKVYYGYPNLY